TFWAKVDAALDSNISFVLGTGADLSGTATETYLINPTGTGWEKHTVTLSGGNDDSAAYYGIVLSTDAAGTFYLDSVEIAAKFNSNADPMKTFASELVLTLSNVSNGGDGIDFSGTTDADDDGIISDESTKSHKIMVQFSDNFQQIVDLAWSASALGKDDGDIILDEGEKFEVTIDLTNVNNNAGWDFKKISTGHNFNIEIKPPTGAVLNMERTMSSIIHDVNDLN
ncbi:MAG: hypothetical protein PHE50_09565, partial [Dehalococcoidales bacterium]|nr:hypothetical protein [Dehalococcoidales bacterium]